MSLSVQCIKTVLQSMKLDIFEYEATDGYHLEFSGPIGQRFFAIVSATRSTIRVGAHYPEDCYPVQILSLSDPEALSKLRGIVRLWFALSGEP